ncbi:uncharacterized protein J3D65DRAFT_250740 [Phyllosticta citribraziliensis]|uniref:FAD-binding domain-containing protein n=1 Tax=Phyllosticta citribraziliensis TaxID=989973 RepID=A0ABR1LZT8_9PEZI
MGSLSEDISVMVIGAGSGGRLIAQGLKKAGIKCTVFERDPDLDSRPRDWNFGIYWAQTSLDECLPKEASEKIISAQVDNFRPSPDAFIPFFNGVTGELMTQLDTPYYLRLRRREFARVMGSGIDVRYNKKLVSIDAESGPGVTASFADGTQHTATLLVGAEGAHSPTREYLLGPEKGKLLYSDIVMASSLIKLPADKVRELQALHERITCALHPNGNFLWLATHDAVSSPDPAEWTFLFLMSWRQTGPLSYSSSADIMRDLKARCEAFGDVFRSITRAAPDDAPAWANYLPYWPSQPWADHPAHGKVTLAGDAVHPMTPHRGQGLNNAILDCAQLVQQIAAMPTHTPAALADAVKRYEREVVARGSEVVASNLQNSLDVHDWERLMQSMIFKYSVAQKVPGAAKAETGEDGGREREVGSGRAE